MNEATAVQNTPAFSHMEHSSNYPACVHKTWFLRETIHRDIENEAPASIVRVAGVAVMANEWAGKTPPDLDALALLGENVAAAMMPDLVAMLGAPVLAYGKAAIVGTRGRLEHGAALLHPQLGRPVRALIGGGASVMPSNNKIGRTGSSIDVPLGHKDDAWSFAFLDTMTLSLSDAPREDEIALFLVLAAGQRAFARIGSRKED